MMNLDMRCTAAVVILCASAVSPALAADDTKFSISLGVFITDRDSQTRLDVSGGGNGTPVDLEGELGLDTSDSVFRVDGSYRFNDKHRINFSAFDLSRTGSKQIERDIDWQGTIYPVSALVDSEFDLNIYKLAYTYSFMRRDKGYLGLTAGVYVADIGVRLSAANIATGDGGAITAPLPVVGLRGEYQIADKWSFRASGEFFALEYDAFKGSLTDLYVGIDYQLFEHMALGLGLNSVTMDIGIDDGDALNANLDWQYDGGLLFFKFDF